MSTMQTAQCLMAVPCCCTIPIGLCMMKNAMGNPPDARKLSEDEAKPYIEGLQGKSKASTKIGQLRQLRFLNLFILRHMGSDTHRDPDKGLWGRWHD